MSTTTGTMPFGKHRGMSIASMVSRYPKYARWVLTNTRIKATHPEAHMDIEVRLEVLGLYRELGLL